MAPLEQKELPQVTHLLVASTLVFMTLVALNNYYLYTLLSYEDHLLEWSTVVFYLAAAFLGFRFAIRRRRILDGLVALYCLLAGGEEFSWGQRLLGLSPPKYFMEANQQQEINFHNFFSGGSHDLVFALVAIGYFILLPLLDHHSRTRTLLEKLGATAPPARLMPWAVLLTVLHTWHPIHFSSEWYEAILAGLFFTASASLSRNKLSAKQVLLSVTVVLCLSIILMQVSTRQEGQHHAENTSCAKIEAQELLKGIVEGKAATAKLRLVVGHKRVFEAAKDGTLDGAQLTRFQDVRCTRNDDEQTQLRRQYNVDPWGMSYWLHAEQRAEGSLKLTIYSFGANRRRDSGETVPGANVLAKGDDIVETAYLSYQPSESAPDPTVFSIGNTP